jgi:hypothetical protein
MNSDDQTTDKAQKSRTRVFKFFTPSMDKIVISMGSSKFIKQEI